jgi:hypothetical protein
MGPGSDSMWRERGFLLGDVESLPALSSLSLWLSTHAQNTKPKYSVSVYKK